MACPFCGAEGSRRSVHGHLVREHADRVVTAESTTLQLSYELACPACALVIKRFVNPRNRDPRFLEENGAEIRLVAFDQLLYHLEAAHSEAAHSEAAGEPLGKG